MTEIIPAVLTENFRELSVQLKKVASVASVVHVDIADGIFVPRVSWPFTPADQPRFTAITGEEEGLPEWQKLDYEIHVMAMHPELLADNWIRAGALRYIAHVEALESFEKLKEAVGNRMELGLALKFETSLDHVAAHANEISVLQMMTISRIGFQGSLSFEPGVFAKIKEARAKFPDLHISVDGGVTLQNAESLIRAGADTLIVGSSLFRATDFREAWESFNDIARSHGR